MEKIPKDVIYVAIGIDEHYDKYAEETYFFVDYVQKINKGRRNCLQSISTSDKLQAYANRFGTLAQAEEYKNTLMDSIK